MSALNRKRDAVADEAVTWLHRLGPDCTDECRSGFLDWYKESDLHKEQFLIVAALREGLGKLAVEADSRGSAAAQDPPRGKTEPGWRNWLIPAGLAIAGSTILVTLAIALFDRLTTTHDSLVAPMVASERITLRDGSTIQLNTHARAQMVSSRHSRELHLYEGEVQISVARDDSRPFSLVSGPFVVRDVGTQLLASSAGTGIRLLVLEGGVRMTGDCRSPAAVAQMTVRLVRQQQISVPDNHCTSGWRPRTLPQHEIDQKIAWTLDPFYFHGDRLADVADRFNRYNALQLKVDPAVGDRRVSGHFPATDPRGFVRSVEKSLGVKMSAVPPGTATATQIFVVDSHAEPQP
jgi:transmembrane sensor